MTLALVEKIAALGAEEILEERSKRANEEKFDRAMSKIAKIDPPEYDRL